jgi:predicted RNA-binding protein YlqC (UPF0109 family)
MPYNLGLGIKADGSTTLASMVLDYYTSFGQDRASREIEWRASLDAMKGYNGDYWANKQSSDPGKKSNLTTDKESWRSQIFVMLTKSKVIAGGSVLAETILQGGKIPFALIPDKGQDNADSRAAAQEQEQHINDQFAYGKATKEFRRGLLSMALFGDMYIKTPVFKTINQIKYRKIDFMPPEAMQMMQMMPPEQAAQQMVRYEPYLKQMVVPTMQYCSVWDIFRDLTVDDVQDGQAIIERKYISRYDLRKFIGQEGYNEEAIRKVLSSSKDQISVTDTNTKKPSLEDKQLNNTICMLTYWGRVEKKELDDYERSSNGADLGETYGEGAASLLSDPDDDEEVECQIITANGEVILIQPNYLERRPFCYAPWEYVIDEPMGRGIADNIRDDQKLLNTTIRLMIDNLTLAGNVLLAGKSDSFAPGQTRSFYPGKFYELADHVENAQQALQQIIIQDTSAGLQNLIAFIQAQADTDANLPRIMQGDEVGGTKTAFETDQLVQNAGKYIGQVIVNIDEGIIVPTVEANYNYNMMAEGNNEMKGSFIVNANGFNSFQNKIVKVQSIKELIGMMLSNPVLAAEARLRPHIEEIYKGHDLIPEDFLKSEEEKAQEQEAQAAQNQPPPPPPPKPTINYQDTPPDIQRQIEAMAGMQPSTMVQVPLNAPVGQPQEQAPMMPPPGMPQQ